MSFLPKDLEPGEPTVMMGEELDKKDKPFVKKLVGKLRKGSKTHAKQADDLEKAVNEGKKYKRDEYGDPIKPDGSYAGKKNEDKNPKDEKITRSEEYVAEVSFNMLKRAYTKSFTKMTEPDKLYKGGVYGRFKKDPETGKSTVKGFQGDTGKVAVMSQGQAQHYLSLIHI